MGIKSIAPYPLLVFCACKHVTGSLDLSKPSLCLKINVTRVQNVTVNKLEFPDLHRASTRSRMFPAAGSLLTDASPRDTNMAAGK